MRTSLFSNGGIVPLKSKHVLVAKIKHKPRVVQHNIKQLKPQQKRELFVLVLLVLGNVAIPLILRFYPKHKIYAVIKRFASMSSDE